MEYATLVFSLLGLVFTFFWLRKPEDKKDKRLAIYSLVGCVAMLGLSLYAIIV